MEQSIEFPLIPPSVNASYHTTRRGGFYKDNKIKNFQIELKFRYLRKLKKIGNEKVGIITEFYFKNKKHKDIDNMHKSLLDAITNAGIWEDDRNVVLLISYLHLDYGSEKTKITLLTGEDLQNAIKKNYEE